MRYITHNCPTVKMNKTMYEKSDKNANFIASKLREMSGVQDGMPMVYENAFKVLERAKIYGKLEMVTVTEGEEEKEIFRIIVLDAMDNEVGKIIVDNFTDFSQYYIKKLRFFDKLLFYFNVKDTVEWRVRRRTRELFHAEVLFSGLF